MIVMFTDGVGEVEPSNLPGGEWIKKAAGGSANPQEAADRILKTALETLHGAQEGRYEA